MLETVFAVAILAFIGYVARQVWIIKTNDLKHLEINLKKLMRHHDVDWEE